MLSVTTFCSFQREFSPLEVYGDKIGGLWWTRSWVSGDVSALLQEDGRDSCVTAPILSAI
jgi:hypothetical protein